MSEPMTLGQINKQLNTLGFNASINPTLATQIQGMETEAGKFLNALERAHEDANAKRWIGKMLERIGFPNAAANDGGSQPVNNAPSQTPSAQTPQDRPSTADNQNNGQNRGGIARETLTFHVYGVKAALSFEMDSTRSGRPTVALDAAFSISEKKFNWEEKTRIQLTPQELPTVTAVLMGYIPRCEFKNHGKANNKGFSIENQGNNFFVRVMEKDNGVKAVPMNHEDAFYVVGLLLRQISRVFPELDGTTVEAMIKRYAAVKLGHGATVKR